jgi:hypothetical protein
VTGRPPREPYIVNVAVHLRETTALGAELQVCSTLSMLVAAGDIDAFDLGAIEPGATTTTETE